MPLSHNRILDNTDKRRVISGYKTIDKNLKERQISKQIRVLINIA